MDYYLIVQNTQEVISIGRFDGLKDAEDYVLAQEDHLTHGERWIVVTGSFKF